MSIAQRSSIQGSGGGSTPTAPQVTTFAFSSARLPVPADRSNSGVAVLGLGGCLGALNVVLCLSARMRWLFSYEYRKYLAEAPNAAYSEDAGAKLVFDSKLSRSKRSKRFTCADIPPGVL